MLYNDINLIPQKKKGLSASRIFIYSLLFITVLSYFGNYFVYEPLVKRKEARDKLEKVNNEILSYGNIANDYVLAQTNYNEYLKKIEALKSIVEEDFNATDEIAAIFEACPEGVVIKSYSFKKGALSISAQADSYELIGKYLNGLESNEHFSNVKYSSIGHFMEEERDKYTFSLSVDVNK